MAIRRAGAIVGILFLCAAGLHAEEEQTSPLGLRYLLRVPSSYDEEAGMPLVICLHGRGGNKEQEFSMWRAQGRDVILVAPDAPNPGEWHFDKDLKPVVALTLELKKKYAVTYTIVGGFSRGGYFSYYLGLKHPRVYDGIVSFVASCLFDPPRSAECQNLPIFIANGDQDQMTPLKHAQGTVRKFRDAGYRRVKYVEMKDAGHEVTGEAWSECWTFLEETVAARAESARLYDRAKKAADAKETEKALELLDELLERWPESAAATKAKDLRKRVADGK